MKNILLLINSSPLPSPQRGEGTRIRNSPQRGEGIDIKVSPQRQGIKVEIFRSERVGKEIMINAELTPHNIFLRGKDLYPISSIFLRNNTSTTVFSPLLWGKLSYHLSSPFLRERIKVRVRK